MIYTTRIVALLMLAGIAVHRYTVQHPPIGVEHYQARIRAAGAELTRQIGPWVGADCPVPVQALSVLRPNLILSRRYLNVETGASAGVMLVHCSDAHYMVGHYPLRCYPAAGWILKSSRPRDWNVDGLIITGSEYAFTRQDFGPKGAGEESIVVISCLFRPGHAVLRNMAELSRSMGGPSDSAFGAGQIQIYFNDGKSRAQRDAAVASLIKGYRPVIDAILARPGR